MASTKLHIISGLDGQHLQTISVAEDTEIHDILEKEKEKEKV